MTRRNKNRAVDIPRRRENDFAQFVILSVALGEFAVDVFHHDHGAVDDDPEIDCADRKQVGGHASPVQQDEREEQAERDRQGQ